MREGLGLVLQPASCGGAGLDKGLHSFWCQKPEPVWYKNHICAYSNSVKCVVRVPENPWGSGRVAGQAKRCAQWSRGRMAARSWIPLSLFSPGVKPSFLSPSPFPGAEAGRVWKSLCAIGVPHEALLTQCMKPVDRESCDHSERPQKLRAHFESTYVTVQQAKPATVSA